MLNKTSRSAALDLSRTFQGEDLDNVELKPDLVAQLLDSNSWAEKLELYAQTAGLAVALADINGRIIGACHNPQAVWSLVRGAKSNSAGTCPFCLEMSPRCNAAAAVRRTKRLTLVHDQAGFAHVALLLTLGGRDVGMLLAGQILDRYPEALPLQRTAREFGLSPQQLWHFARQQVPMSHGSLVTYGKLLWTLGQGFLRDRYSAIIEAKLVAERAHEEDLLRHMNVDLKNFSYAASHDLQEPLRMVKTSSQLLTLEYKGKLDPLGDQLVGYITEGAQQLETLLGKLREYWLVNEPLARCSPVDSAWVLAETIKMLRVPIEESSATLTFHNLPTVMAEEVALAMLFQNLIGNAIKYTPAGRVPHVQISAEDKGKEWLFFVKDNGIGIQAEYLEQIFAPFKRLNGRAYPGSGLGLTLCKKIVERFGGQLWVESVYGEGSTFSFTIPASG